MELLTVKDVASRLKVSARQVWKMRASGKIPGPVNLSRSVRWLASDIDEWILRGCPSREKFEQARAKQ